VESQKTGMTKSFCPIKQYSKPVYSSFFFKTRAINNDNENSKMYFQKSMGKSLCNKKVLVNTILYKDK